MRKIARQVFFHRGRRTEPAQADVIMSAPALNANLKTLESRGFIDRRRNIQVLVRQRNRLFEAIQELLQ